MILNRNLIKNIINLMISNFLTLIIGVLSLLVTPIILGHVEYGYYRIFTLYTTYVPLLHLGFIDGILIKYAGLYENDISRKKFRTYTEFILILELLLSVTIILIGFFVYKSGINMELVLFTGIYSFLLNLTTYFQFFSKATIHFSELAAVTRFQSLLNGFFILVALISYKFNFIRAGILYYLIYVNFVLLVILTYYIFRYKSIVFGDRIKFSHLKKMIYHLVKIGFGIMISYQLIMIITNSDNQFVSMFFSVISFSKYSLSYSLSFVLITVFGSISSVLLPYMKRQGRDIVIEKYSDTLSINCMLVFLLVSCYYPLCFIVNNFLPSYRESLTYLLIIFPGVSIACIVQSHIFNNYIIVKRMKQFSLITILNILLDYVVYYFSYVLFKSMFIISVLSVILLIIWYLCLDVYFSKTFNTPFLKNSMYIITMTIFFILIGKFFTEVLGFILFIVLYSVLTFSFYKEKITNMYLSIVNSI